MSLRTTTLLLAMMGLGACAPTTVPDTAPASTASRLQPQETRCNDDDDVVTCLRRFASPIPKTFTARFDCSAFTERSDKVMIERSTHAARQVRFPARARESGSVRLRMQVDDSGRLVNTRVLESSGNVLLEAAAMEAAQDWCYLPARKDGRDVGGEVDASFNFEVIGWSARDGASQRAAP